MASEAVAAAAGARSVGSDELAQGLLLMRASAIKVVRLQLAMERRDRRAAIEAVDELMGLDRRLGEFLDDLPVADGPLSAARAEVEAQGRALAREKLTLVAGVHGPRLAPRPEWVELARPAADPAAQERPPAPLELEPTQILLDDPEPRASGSRLIAAGLVLVLLLLGGLAFYLLSGAAAGWPPLDAVIDGVVR
ncbi:hypothetical protein [Sphingosinicella terrae]|uniref:hypothetical protein n=1 Tax=Sphingosinicella terrae TaxID=2172047 RepID=UPI000E0DECAA|nr:hypothetical protein [Sphingosinicella terrae]